jgi:hypothetical protein
MPTWNAGPIETEEKFRTFRTGPQSERGGTIACTRIQSEDTASTESDALVETKAEQGGDGNRGRLSGGFYSFDSVPQAPRLSRVRQV